jgi:hypothetical protein
MTMAIQETPLELVETLIPLSRVEARRFKECEKVIERGLDTFYEVGNSLTEIRDARYYRMEFSSFEDYCRERWDMSRPRAYQLMGAAAVLDNLSTIVDKPTNEAQARELAPLDERAQRAVWQIALDTATKDEAGNPVVTAGHIKSVVKTISEIVECGGVDDGSGETKPLGTLIDAAITEETYERLQRQKEYIKGKVEQETEEKERKIRFKSDRSEVEVVYDAAVQSDLARYIATITEFEDIQWPGELEYFGRMFQLHKAHAHFQKTRNVADDCEHILSVLKKLSPDVDAGFEIAAQELYDWLFDLGYCMSKKEYTTRLEHMSRDDIRMALLTNAGDGKQEDRRGALPGIVAVPWKKKWDQGSKRERDDEDED